MFVLARNDEHLPSFDERGKESCAFVELTGGDFISLHCQWGTLPISSTYQKFRHMLQSFQKVMGSKCLSNRHCLRANFQPERYCCKLPQSYIECVSILTDIPLTNINQEFPEIEKQSLALTT